MFTPLVEFGWLADAVRTATGPLALVLIAVYSFLIAVVLPLPSEVVLYPATTMDIGLSYPLTLALVILVSGVGKAAGSVVALTLGHTATHSGPVVTACRRLGFNPVEWSQARAVELARRWGYVGLAAALSVPFFPDTLSIYAFSVLEDDYRKFALATFAGSVGRLLVTLVVFHGAAIAV
ncbi:YqaA family protein [Halocalculus aciditolerans]|uniref:VTT domain-containing protein n=1 Tax=Halocalculus aciditolerans TaxID=1383812 RepID=A0A830FQJ6_9EURY|nr:VTT domain-containing protein [Halocalculus aciditolerans]GGL70899.1 hypothetical protein GCM10009039_31230 [Halocalculus aciditolerans]